MHMYISHSVVKEVLTEMMTFEQRLKGAEGTSQVAIWGKNTPVGGHNKGKGPETRARLQCSRL